MQPQVSQGSSISTQATAFGSVAAPAKDKNDSPPQGPFASLKATGFSPVPQYTPGSFNNTAPAIGISPVNAFPFTAVSQQRILAEKRYKNKEYLEAFLCYYELFKLNEKEYDAAYYMGHMLYEGLGVQVDYKKAYEWILKAATGGYNKAYARLGDCYYHGRGTIQSYSAAAQWYRKGVNLGDASANKGLGMICYYGKNGGKDLRSAFQYFLSAAQTEDKEVQFHLALCYHYGYGVESGRFQAVSWYTKAALQGHITAAYNAGILYYEGLDQHTPPDYAAAFHYYQKAAEGKYADAMCNLGYLYEKGHGVKSIDYKKAFEWYEKASLAGSFQATQNLGELYMKGLGTVKDLGLALKYFKKAKEGGIIESDEYIRQVESTKSPAFVGQSINNNSSNESQEVLALKKQLQQVQNEAQAQLTKKDKKITVLLDQMKVQHDQINKLIFQMASN